MILTDREIQAAISNGTITVDPEPTLDKYSSSSLDLTLASEIRLWKPSIDATKLSICPGHPKFDYRSIANQLSTMETIGSNGFDLKPGAFLLAWTFESIDLPTASGLAARVEGKSSLARLGIAVHVTAPTIHSGFAGPIQLEMCNHGPLTIQLDAGMPVCQLILEQTYGTPEKGYRGRFQGQTKS